MTVPTQVGGRHREDGDRERNFNARFSDTTY
jgi:hypothetical protein